MGYIEAVVDILKEVGRPLNVKEIVKIGVEKNFLEEKEDNLEEIIDSMILNDIKTKGIRSSFSRIGPGTYFIRNINFNHRQSNFHRKREKFMRHRGQEISQRDEERADINFKDNSRRENKSFSVDDVKEVNKDVDVDKKHTEDKKWVEDKKHTEVVKNDAAKAIENIGKQMNYEVTFGEDGIILWKRSNNPEVAFIVKPEFSSALMGKIVDLRNDNFRKIVLILNEEEIENSERFFPNEDIKTWCEIWSDKLIKEMGYHCEKFIENFKKLIDFRDISKKGIYFFK